MAKQEKAPSKALLLIRNQLKERIMEEFTRGDSPAPGPAAVSFAPETPTKKARNMEEALEKEEELYREARKEYETTGESLLAVARNHDLKYDDLRLHIRMYHPESHLMNIYARQTGEVTATVSRQIREIQKLGENTLRRMSEELDAELAKLGKSAS